MTSTKLLKISGQKFRGAFEVLETIFSICLNFDLDHIHHNFFKKIE